MLGAAVKLTGWRNRVPIAARSPQKGLGYTYSVPPVSSCLGREKAVRSAALAEFLPLGRKHQEWERRVPPTLSLALTARAVLFRP